MRVLIVEDNARKKEVVRSVLKRKEITDISNEMFVSRVLQRVNQEEFDFIITDLGLPRFLDNPIVEDPKEGLKMLYDLAYDEKKIPAIIYSTTELLDEQINYLNELEYPYYGQATNKDELQEKVELLLKEWQPKSQSENKTIIKNRK